MDQFINEVKSNIINWKQYF